MEEKFPCQTRTLQLKLVSRKRMKALPPLLKVVFALNHFYFTSSIEKGYTEENLGANITIIAHTFHCSCSICENQPVCYCIHKNRKLIYICPNLSPEFGFSNFFSNTVLKHYWMWKFLSVYSYFFMRIWRIQGKCLSVYGEYGEFRVICGTQNLLRIRGKNLCVHSWIRSASVEF